MLVTRQPQEPPSLFCILAAGAELFTFEIQVKWLFSVWVNQIIGALVNGLANALIQNNRWLFLPQLNCLLE